MITEQPRNDLLAGPTQRFTQSTHAPLTRLVHVAIYSMSLTKNHNSFRCVQDDGWEQAQLASQSKCHDSDPTVSAPGTLETYDQGIPCDEVLGIIVDFDSTERLTQRGQVLVANMA